MCPVVCAYHFTVHGTRYVCFHSPTVYSAHSRLTLYLLSDYLLTYLDHVRSTALSLHYTVYTCFTSSKRMPPTKLSGVVLSARTEPPWLAVFMAHAGNS